MSIERARPGLPSSMSSETPDCIVPRVSVVVPAYNAQETLADCLACLVSQQGLELGRDYEVIVVNDGSTDGTASIASRYPVRLISLERNRGRIVARRTGAEAARSDMLLLIDTRVMAAPDLLKTALGIGHTPLIAGDLGEDKYRSHLETSLYLLRRLIYWPYHPQSRYGRELWIDARNFYRAPKGTGCLLIGKRMFLEALPEAQGKTVNDDTKIFASIVFDKGLPLLRHTDLKARYVSRLDLLNARKWLFQRGILFADFLLFKNALYPALLLAPLVALALLIAGGVVFPMAALAVAGVCFVGYAGVAAWAAENLRDFGILMRSLPWIAAVFWAGAVWGLALKWKARQ